MTQNRKWNLPLGILFAVLALGILVAMVWASADDLLHQSARLLADSTDGHAIVSFELEAPEKNGSGTIELWGKKEAGPDGEPAFRVEILESSLEKTAGIIAVGDGTQVSIWRPSNNTVYVGTLEELKARLREHAADYEGEFEHDHDLPEHEEGDHPQTAEEAVDKLLEYVTAERAGTEDVAGTAANLLRLIPIAEQMPDEFRTNGGLFNVWLRTDDNAPLAAEYTGGAVGYGKVTASLLELDQGIDDTVFTLEIPDGAEVVNLADLEFDPPPSLSLQEAAEVAEFAVLTPERLPGSARLQGINEVRGAIVQRYRLSDGGSFTVAQGTQDAAGTPEGSAGESVTVLGQTGTLYQGEDGTRTLLTWNDGKFSYWVGGDLSAGEALEIANSLK